MTRSDIKRALSALGFCAFLNASVALACISGAPGCAGQSDAAREAMMVEYTAEARRCEANIQQIVDDHDSTERRDLANLASEQRRCASALSDILNRHGE